MMRSLAWGQLSQTPWDVLVIGGGITGAGVAREAVRCGLRTLLVEQQDFSWGTSSRSSKLVHGGLRYLSQGAFRLTQHALQERERLLLEAPGLVTRQRFHWLHRYRVFPGRWPMAMVLALYDLMAGVKDRGYLSAEATTAVFPGLRAEDLQGASFYTDALTDDARLVLRVLSEGEAEGLVAFNYVRAEGLLRDESGQVVGARLVAASAHLAPLEVRARVVVNATGAWADRLRQPLTGETRIRPLRGSHLVFSAQRLPLSQALIVQHPQDRRVYFIYPWAGRTVVGTTDLDHRDDIDLEAALTVDELNYLLAGVNHEFPDAHLTPADVISTWSGVRPVVRAGRGQDPSQESRAHQVWQDQGLVTVTGGKLTTFRSMAWDVLRAAQPLLGPLTADPSAPVFAPLPDEPCPAGVSRSDHERLGARYGALRGLFYAEMPRSEWHPVADTDTWLAECRWACRHEQVRHLDDLLLRRTRLGLCLPAGGLAALPTLDTLLQETLGWTSAQCAAERSRYETIWQQAYGLPQG